MISSKGTNDVSHYVSDVRKLQSLIEDDLCVRDAICYVNTETLLKAQSECVDLKVRAAQMRRERATWKISEQRKKAAFRETCEALKAAEATVDKLLQTLARLLNASGRPDGEPGTYKRYLSTASAERPQSVPT